MKIRTEVLREVRKMRFLEVYDRYVGGRLSLVEAAETLGMSERQFRRVRGRFAAEGEAGLLDRRLGKVSPHRIAADEVERIVSLYRDRYAGWTAKHFHERAAEKHGLKASYGWTKSVLTAAGLRRPAVRRSAHRKKRECPKFCVSGVWVNDRALSELRARTGRRTGRQTGPWRRSIQ
jgi:transposase